ncbi:MAG: carbohydrate porin [Candidatus Omnitrophica bacterium]|nr:carbohydrate porin [Candidatus Omnitrophota bacterium]
MCLNNVYILLVTLTLSVAIPSSQAARTPLEVSEQEEEKVEISPVDSWLKDFDAQRESFAEKYGTRFAFLFNYAQQAIIKSKHDEGKSRGPWYWDLEIEQKLWPGGALFAEFEMDKGKGVDKFLPTYSVFSDNAGESAWFYLPALYIEQKLFKDEITFTAGKLNLSDWFDYNEVAGCGDTQFSSSALVNNPTIPFPYIGIAALVNFEPYEWLYFQSGTGTAKVSYTKTGLSDAFNSAFFINELGLTPKFGSLQGNYRFIFYTNHQKLDYLNSDETKKNDSGFALSFDQAITKNATLFFRYGVADPKVRDIEYFWSCGAQVTEPFPGRKFDCLGIGVAQSIVGDDYREANGYDETWRAETMYEAYYSYYLNGCMALTPNLQVVTHPSVDKAEGTEIVCGLRFLLSF